MNQRVLLNLLLLIGVLALIAVVYFKPGIETPPTLPPLTTLDSDQIKRIDIVRDKSTVTLERRDGSWWIAGDTPIAADPMQIESLLGLAGAVPERSYAVGELDLAKLKLAPPETTLRLDTRPGELWLLSPDNTAPGDWTVVIAMTGRDGAGNPFERLSVLGFLAQ